MLEIFHDTCSTSFISYYKDFPFMLPPNNPLFTTLHTCFGGEMWIFCDFLVIISFINIVHTHLFNSFRKKNLRNNKRGIENESWVEKLIFYVWYDVPTLHNGVFCTFLCKFFYSCYLEFAVFFFDVLIFSRCVFLVY